MASLSDNDSIMNIAIVLAIIYSPVVPIRSPTKQLSLLCTNVVAIARVQPI